jgi:hypothetical protein
MISLSLLECWAIRDYSHIEYDILLIDSYVTLPVSVVFLTALTIPHNTYLRTVPVSTILTIVCICCILSLLSSTTFHTTCTSTRSADAGIQGIMPSAPTL